MAKIPVTNQDWLELIVHKRRESMIAGLREAEEFVRSEWQSFDGGDSIIEAIKARISELEEINLQANNINELGPKNNKTGLKGNHPP